MFRSINKVFVIRKDRRKEIRKISKENLENFSHSKWESLYVLKIFTVIGFQSSLDHSSESCAAKISSMSFSRLILC